MSRVIDLARFGCRGDGQTLNTAPLQAAADELKESGGTLLLPTGDYVCGLVRLYSHSTLHLAKGARLISSPRMEDHYLENKLGGLLFAADAENITLSGEGTIDGNAGAYFQPGQAHAGTGGIELASTWQGRRGLPYGSESTEHGPWCAPERPGNLLVFARCHHVHIHGLTLQGATYWTLHLADCEQAHLADLTINNDPRHPNNDGIHLTTCRHAKIERCRITAGDDAIALTGFCEPRSEPEIALGLSGLRGECADIQIKDCELSSRSSAFRIGYAENPTRRVHIENCRIHHSNRGLYLYAAESDVEDIMVKNCSIQTQLYHGDWWGCGEPISLAAVRFPGTSSHANIRRVYLQNIQVESPIGVSLYTENPDGIEEVTLEKVDIHLTTDALQLLKGGNIDLRPVADHAIAVLEQTRAPILTHQAQPTVIH